MMVSVINGVFYICLQNSNKVNIFYLTGNTGLKNWDKTVPKNMISNGTKLSFNLYEPKIKEDAGSTG